MSRRPKPTALKELAGNPGKRPLNASEPHPTKGIPEMPKGLAPAARREWHRITHDLMALGVLTVIDGKALAMYCDAYSDWQEAQRNCRKDGMWIDTPVLDKGNMPIQLNDGRWMMVRKENAAFNIKCKAIKTMKAFLIEFGLTPASRSKLKMPKKEETDPMEDFLNSGPGQTSDGTNESRQMPSYFKTGTVDISRTDA